MKVTRSSEGPSGSESKRDVEASPAPATREATGGTPRPHALDVFAPLDAQTGSRALPGNRVELLFDGVSSFAERSKMIDGARQSICLQTYIFGSDNTGWALAAKLAAKAQAGVQVRVIVDAMGCRSTDPKVFELMRKAGVEVRTHAPLYDVTALNHRWHEKHLLVDGRASIEGGMNIADEYALGGSDRLVFSNTSRTREPFRDVDVKLEGPSVAAAMTAFVRNWAELGGVLTPSEKAKLFPKLEAQPSGVQVRVVQSNPELKGSEGNTDRLYLDAIRAAKRSITIENAYFLPASELRAALLDAVKRGVVVRVMTNSYASNDTGAVADASRYFYDDLLKAGVKIYEKQGGLLHSKTATFDGQYSIVGSVNLNSRSHGQDTEDAVAIAGAVTARQLEDRFATGLSQTLEVTQADLERESVLTNLRQWAFSNFAWIF